MNTKLAIGGTLLFIGNARVVTNLILSGMFDRHPDLKMVSVESGVGWIPFILEALDYEMAENAPDELAELKKMPSEYFRSNMYATFWFENNRNKLPELIEAVGEDNILFETDFPHPTCLYPNPLADRRGEDGDALARGARARSRRERAASSTGSERGSEPRGHDRALDRRPARRGHIGAVVTRVRPRARRADRRGDAGLGSRGRRRRQGRGGRVRRVGRVADEPARRGDVPAARAASTRTATTSRRSSPASTARFAPTPRRGRPRPGVRRVRVRHPAPAEGRAQLRGLDRRRRPHRRCSRSASWRASPRSTSP